MEELVKLVSKKTGISEAVAKQAVEVVVGFLKTKLPAPIAAQVEAALGSSGASKQAGDVLKGLGGMLGKK